MALLMRVLLTASQVLTVDSKIANVEANIFNFLAVDGFQVAGTALVLAPWYHFQASFFADRGWFLCSGALTVGGLPRSHVDVQICVLTSWIQVGLGSRPLVGPGSSTCTRGTCCLASGAVLGMIGGSALRVRPSGSPVLFVCVWALPCGPWKGLL